MMLSMFAGENRDDWDDLLPVVMMAYRSSVHKSTGYRLMFGEECTLPMDGSVISGLSDACLQWEIGFCVITHRLKNANWIQPGLDPILLFRWQDGLLVFSYNQIHQLSWFIVRT